MPDVRLEESKAYLDWWRAAGVLEGISESPTDWFDAACNEIARGQAAVRPAPQSVAKGPRISQLSPAAAPAPVPVAPQAAPVGEATQAARALAGSVNSLDALRTQLETFNGCGLQATAKSLCFYRGQPQARLMLIGEAPGRDEDLAGKPFVGRAGQLLDKMLAAIGIDESKVHITNSVYWRPPGNRTPTPEEMAACWPFLERQIELVNPDVILLAGGVAAKQVLGLVEGITKLRGQWRSLMVCGREVRVLATLHPSYLLRTPAAKRQAWQDMLMIQLALQM